MAAARVGFMLRNAVETAEAPSAQSKAEDVAADWFFSMEADPVCGWRRKGNGRFDYPRDARMGWIAEGLHPRSAVRGGVNDRRSAGLW